MKWEYRIFAQEGGGSHTRAEGISKIVLQSKRGSQERSWGTTSSLGKKSRFEETGPPEVSLIKAYNKRN